MIVILHLVIAFFSIIFTTFAYIKPSHRVLVVSYGLIGLTLTSGLYLVVMAPAHMLTACVMGVVYLSAASVGVVLARIKLSKHIIATAGSNS